MPLKPETKFKNKVMPLLRALPYSWWEKIQQKSIRGTPDIIGCMNGTFIAIELKSDKHSKVDELQRWKLDQIDRAGGISVILYPGNWDKWYKKFKKYAKGEANGI